MESLKDRIEKMSGMELAEKLAKTKDPEEKRRLYRAIGCGYDKPLKPHTIQCDFFAEFARRKNLTDPSYIMTWAERFARGEEFHYADEKSQKILLDIMVEGTAPENAPHIKEETIKEWAKKRFGKI